MYVSSFNWRGQAIGEAAVIAIHVAAENWVSEGRELAAVTVQNEVAIHHEGVFSDIINLVDQVMEFLGSPGSINTVHFNGVCVRDEEGEAICGGLFLGCRNHA
jgi:hypothetical protein